MSTRFVVPHCMCVYYICRCIDFSPRVDASGGADGFRTLVVVVTFTSARTSWETRESGEKKKMPT